MRAVVQRVSKAAVHIGGAVKGTIDKGLLVLIAFRDSDNRHTIEWMCNKLVNLRVFPDKEGKMNRSVMESGGGILLVSNFTLYGDARKGFRPSFIEAAAPDKAIPIYEEMIKYLKENYSIPVETGEFGAMMDIELVNDGPVTIIIDKD